MWNGSDGGISKTDVSGPIIPGPKGGFTWSSRNSNYITYQYYYADINPEPGSNFVAGSAQDNAFTVQPDSAIAKEVGPTVDGTCVGVISGTSFSNFNLIECWQNGGLQRHQDNMSVWDIQPDNQKQGFLAYFFLDPDNTNHLFYPANSGKLYRTRNARNITTNVIGNDPSTGWQELSGVTSSMMGDITTMEATRNIFYSGNLPYSISDETRYLFIGTDAGNVYRLSDPAYCTVGTVPIPIKPDGAVGFVSDIAVNPKNQREIVVTYRIR